MLFPTPKIAMIFGDILAYTKDFRGQSAFLFGWRSDLLFHLESGARGTQGRWVILMGTLLTATT
jgi:hypothetical protein